MRSSRWRIAAIAVTATFGVSACAQGADVSNMQVLIRPQWSVPAALVGSPAVADGVVVSYVDGGIDRLEIVAWEVATGTELWRQPATLGSIAPFHEPTAVITSDTDTDTVAFLQDDPDDDGGWQRVIVAHLRTGNHLDDGTLDVDATTLPWQCDDSGGVCLRGRALDQYEYGEQLLRVDLGSNSLVSEAGPSLPSNARFLGSNVYSTLDREPEGSELLGFASNGVTLWERPYTEVFGVGFSSDGGWWWLDDDDRAVLVGSGSPYDPATAEEPVATIDLTAEEIVGLNPDSGETVWKVGGADRYCDAAEVADHLVDDVVPMCIFASGTLTIDRTDRDAPTLQATDVDATLVGVEITTGKRAWSLPLGGDASVVGSFVSKFRSQTSVRPVRVDGELRLVDVLTGQTAGVPAGARLACESERAPISAHYLGKPDNSVERYGAGFGAYACDSERDPSADDALSPGALDLAAVDAGDGWLIVDGVDSLFAYRRAA